MEGFCKGQRQDWIPLSFCFAWCMLCLTKADSPQNLLTGRDINALVMTCPPLQNAEECCVLDYIETNFEEHKVTGNYTSHWLSIADSSLTHPKVRYPSTMAATAHFDPLSERLTSSLVYCLNCMFANGSKNQVQLSLQDTRNKLTCEYHCKQKDQQMAVISLPAIVNDVPLTGLTCSVPSGAERTNRTEMTCHNAGQFSSSHDAAFETFQILLTPEEYRGIAANSTAMVVHNSSDGFRLWRVTSLNSVMHITLYVPQKQNIFGALDLRQDEDADSAPKVLPIVAGLLLAVCCAAFVVVCKYRTLFKREKKHKLLLESNIHSDAFQLESLTGHF